MIYFILMCLTHVLLTSGVSDTEKNYIKSHSYSTEIILVPEKAQYYVNEPFKAVFRNDLGNTIYVFKSSGISPLMILQKWNGKEWQRINTNRRGVGGIQVVSYHDLKPGEVLETQFPTDRLVENGVEIPGLYRYKLTYYLSSKRDQPIVVASPLFRVEE